MNYLKEEFKKAECDNTNSKYYRCYDELYFISTRRKHDSGYYIFNVYGKRNEKFYNISYGTDVLDFYDTIAELYGFSIDIPEPSVFRIFYHGGFIIVPSCCSNFLMKGKKGSIPEKE